jgi:predicted nucleic acid-binding protein
MTSVRTTTAGTRSRAPRRLGVTAGRRFLEVAFDTPSLTLVAADLELIRASIDGWIAGYPDQTLSLCDALSFEIMRRERVTYALAFDRHFEVAGYQLLR